MSIEQRIAKLKGHVLIFSQEFRGLIECFEMLVPVAENRELLKKISKTRRAPGVGTVRWSLVQICILGITKLAYDNGSRNPTAATLIEAIAAPPITIAERKAERCFLDPHQARPYSRRFFDRGRSCRMAGNRENRGSRATTQFRAISPRT